MFAGSKVLLTRAGKGRASIEKISKGQIRVSRNLKIGSSWRFSMEGLRIFFCGSLSKGYPYCSDGGYRAGDAQTVQIENTEIQIFDDFL